MAVFADPATLEKLIEVAERVFKVLLGATASYGITKGLSESKIISNIYRDAEKAIGAIADGVIQIGEKAVDGAAWIGGKALDGAIWVGGRTVDGAVWIGGKALDGAIWVGGKTIDGAIWVGEKAVDGVTWVGDKAVDAWKGITSLFKKGSKKKEKTKEKEETKEKDQTEGEDNTIKTPSSNPEDFTKLKGNQGYRDKEGNTWKKDQLHKDHWDISNKKGQKIREVDFDGNEIWPNGPKNKNKSLK